MVAGENSSVVVVFGRSASVREAATVSAAACVCACGRRCRNVKHVAYITAISIYMYPYMYPCLCVCVCVCVCVCIH